MSSYAPTSLDMRTQLILLFHLKKSALESHRILVEAYGKLALGRTQCNAWFNKFKTGDFDVRNEERGRPPTKFDDDELQALLDEDAGQTLQELAEQLSVDRRTVGKRLKAMGMVFVASRWVVSQELNDGRQESTE